MANQKINSTDETKRYHVPNLERALVILEYLADHHAGASLSDMADHLKLPMNSVFRIVKTLHAHGYLEYESTKVYRLSRKMLAIGYAAIGENNLLEISRDVLRELRDETSETSLIGILTGLRGLVLEQIPSRQPVKFLVDVGASFPIHTSAPGKAIAAFLPDNERSKLIEEIEYSQFNDRTISNATAMASELKKIRRRGYAIDQEEEIEGLHCIGAAILDHRNYPIASIWITGPKYRLPKSSFDHIGKIVLEKAMTISRRMGYR